MLAAHPLSIPSIAERVASDLAAPLREGARLIYENGIFTLCKDGAEISRAEDVAGLVLLLRLMSAGSIGRRGLFIVQPGAAVLRLIGTTIHYRETLSQYVRSALMAEAERRRLLIEGEGRGHA